MIVCDCARLARLLGSVRGRTAGWKRVIYLSAGFGSEASNRLGVAELLQGYSNHR
jgi:hypothetical protein